METGSENLYFLHMVKKVSKLYSDLNCVWFSGSFHVGSGCYDSTAFSTAVAMARTVFDMGREAGYNFTLLDIGGGFPGQAGAKISFEEVRSDSSYWYSIHQVFYERYFMEMFLRYSLCVHICTDLCLASTVPGYLLPP